MSQRRGPRDASVSNVWIRPVIFSKSLHWSMGDLHDPKMEVR